MCVCVCGCSQANIWLFLFYLQVTHRTNRRGDDYDEVESFCQLFPSRGSVCFQRQQWLGKARLRQWVSDVVLVKGSVALIERRLSLRFLFIYFSLCCWGLYKNMKQFLQLSANCVPLAVKQTADTQLCDPFAGNNQFTDVAARSQPVLTSYITKWNAPKMFFNLWPP